MKKILLASPRGFCAGVLRAIKMVEQAIDTYGTPIYVNHEIVHNLHVIRALEKKGAIFVERLDEIPEGATVVYSAHGVSPQIREEAKKRGLLEIDATCGLVKRIHEAVKQYDEKGYKIVLIGHAHHIEIQGIRDEASHPVAIINSIEEIPSIPFGSNEPIFYATQTTFNQEKEEAIAKELHKKFSRLETLEKSSICYATAQRQKALKKVAINSDLILIIGDPKSSNSQRLLEIAHSFNSHSYLINGSSEIQREWIESASIIGMSAGASTPEWVVENCIAVLKVCGFHSVEECLFS
jgi:4-hydroxy-3-methylbut-2-enyl diphosphate reductase